MLKYNGHTFMNTARCICHFDARQVVLVDPTGTAKLRAKFRNDMSQHWNAVRILVRDMINTRDLLSLKSGGLLQVANPAIMNAGSKVDVFQRWFDLVLQQIVVKGDGSWMRPYLNQAYAIGTKFGQAQAKTQTMHQLGGHRENALQSLARVELQGIVEAVSQQAVRAVAQGLLTNAKTMQITRSVWAAIDTTGRNRANAMIELLTVRAHAEASLDVYEAAGLKTVGLLPESRAQARVVTDAATKPKKKASAKDAKRTGPGSRASRSQVPSKSTIGRIRRAELETARRLGESINVRTAGDDLVCPVCEAISEEGPYSINTARSLIPAHPHCRCVFIPADDARFAQDDTRAVGEFTDA